MLPPRPKLSIWLFVECVRARNLPRSGGTALPLLPRPPCESNVEALNFDGNNTWGCSDKGVVCACREKTQAVTIAS